MQDSDGIIALRAEVEKVSGRAALDSGWAGPKERAKAVYIENGKLFLFFWIRVFEFKKTFKNAPAPKGNEVKISSAL